MKYILKKDLPFAKAGTMIDDILHCRGISSLSYIEIGNCKCELDANIINIFDWIEAVKPRTFYINKTKNGLLHAYYKENSALEGASFDDSETIKVVECI